MTLLYPLENIRTRLQVQVQRKPAAAVGSSADVLASKQQPSLARNGEKHTCHLHAAEREPEECISPETPHLQNQKKGAAGKDAPDAASASSSSTHTSSTSTPYFPLHAPRMPPLEAPCPACSSATSHSSSSSSLIASSTPSSSADATSSSSSTADSAHPYHFRGSLDVIRQVSAREGWYKLYAGLETALIGVGASSAVYFFWYYTFKSLVLAHTSKPTMGPLPNLAVASVAGVVNVFMTLPIWLVNTRMALARKGEYAGVWDAMQKIHAEEGLKGFYRGLVPSLILVSNPAIQFVVYEQMIALYTKAAQRALQVAGTAASGSAVSAAASTAPVRLSSWQYFFLGAFAKAVATVATYPIQVIKSRHQAATNSHQTTWQTIVSMWQHEGVSAYYSGMNAKMSQTVANSAFMFAVYERLVRIILKFMQWLRTEYAGLPKSAP
jgi:adenine nucleotide transporter 17